MAPSTLSSFAEILKPIQSDHLKGDLLMICGHEYQAWDYDTYIYDAIELASRWHKEEVTYDRIIHLRYWLRENIQHGHDLDITELTARSEVKEFIDQLIAEEYPGDEFKEDREFALKNNQEVMGLCG